MTEHRKTTRFDIFGVALLLFSVALCAFGLSQFQSNTEDVLQWLPDNSSSRIEYDQFEKKFGSDDFLIVTWSDCTIDDPRLLSFCQRLTDRDADQMIQSVVNGADVIDKLKTEIDLSSKYAVNRFKGIFFGVDDPTQTLALIELTKKGSANRRESLRQIERAISETPDLDVEQVNFGGYPYVGINIDNQLNASFQYFLLPSIFFATIVSLSCLRSVFLSSIVFTAAIGAAACSIAIVPIFGIKFGGLMPIIPALVYILATSGSIHLIHYSLEAIGDPKRLVSVGWKPCCISALTTAIGMLALGRSSFPAIRHFGFFCATGAGFALIFQLAIVPWLLHRFGQSGQTKLAAKAVRNRFWSALVGQIRRHRIYLAFTGVLIMVVSAAGLTRLSARVEVEKLFDSKSEIITSLVDLEARMGPIDQAEFLIEFENVEAENFHMRAKLVYGIQRHLASFPEIGATHSLHNYLPREPKIKRLMSVLDRKVYRSRIDEQRDEFAKSRFLDVSSNSETWRISLRFPFTQETDVEHQQQLVIDGAAKATDALLSDEQFESISSRPRFLYTGKNHLFHSAQVTLLQDFYRNFLLAFVIITPVLIIVLRSWWLGLIAMLPNLFPIVVLFGGLGWLNWPVDLAIAMTACVALGIAVDDTTHFLIRFREFGGNSSNVVSPIRKAISQCGPAMLQTTAIGCAGLLVYAFSPMVVIRNFALAISCMLVLALLADIFMLPALLLFRGKKTEL